MSTNHSAKWEHQKALSESYQRGPSRLDRIHSARMRAGIALTVLVYVCIAVPLILAFLFLLI
jgi:hypothetical protein